MHSKKYLPKYKTHFSFKNKFYRLCWGIVYILLFRPFSGKIFRQWRNILLRLFGAHVGYRSLVYSSARIWMPCHLHLGQASCIGPNVFCYNPSMIYIGDKVTVSQNTYLCGGSHDIMDIALGFITKPIEIKDYVWICANCFIMMGVKIEEGCIIGATSSLFKSTDPWCVYGGNPAKFIKKRILKSDNQD